jgi:hypothetical protein
MEKRRGTGRKTRLFRMNFCEKNEEDARLSWRDKNRELRKNFREKDKENVGLQYRRSHSSQRRLISRGRLIGLHMGFPQARVS